MHDSRHSSGTKRLQQEPNTLSAIWRSMHGFQFVAFVPQSYKLKNFFLLINNLNFNIYKFFLNLFIISLKNKFLI